MLFGPHGLCLACAATTIHNEQLAFIYLLSLADYPELCGHIIKVITFGFLVFCLLCLNDFAGVMWIGPLLLPSNRLWVFTGNQLRVGCWSVTLFPVACFGVEGAPCVPWAKCETQVRCGFWSETISLFARCRCTSHLGLPGKEAMLKENTIGLCFCDNKTSVQCCVIGWLVCCS